MQTVLIAVQSLDGCITRHEEPGAGFASTADQAWFRRACASCDALVFGSGTYAAARERIRAAATPERPRWVLTRDPARWSADAAPGALAFTAETPAALTARLAAAGVRQLGLLGGARIYDAFLCAGLVDALWLTLEPRVFGSGLRLAASAQDSAWTLAETSRLEADVLLLRYRAAAERPR